jgi:hypothetical protein
MLWHCEPEVPDKLRQARVNEPLSAGDLHRLRLSAERGRPFGDESRVPETARRLRLASALRSKGRPRNNGGPNWLCPLSPRARLRRFRSAAGSRCRRTYRSTFSIKDQRGLRALAQGRREVPVRHRHGVIERSFARPGATAPGRATAGRSIGVAADDLAAGHRRQFLDREE